MPLSGLAAASTHSACIADCALGPAGWPSAKWSTLSFKGCLLGSWFPKCTNHSFGRHARPVCGSKYLKQEHSFTSVPFFKLFICSHHRHTAPFASNATGAPRSCEAVATCSLVFKGCRPVPPTPVCGQGALQTDKCQHKK